MHSLGFLFLSCLLTCASATAQSTWYVDDDNCPGGTGTLSDPFCHIQDAIDIASDGDRIVVAPGTYLESLDYLGKKISVEGQFQAGPVTLDAQGLGPAIQFGSGESREAVLDGFTLVNGTGLQFGPYTAGGVLTCMAGSSPTIRNCIFEGNQADWGGAMLCAFFSEPLVEDSVFRNNIATDTAGAVLCANGGSPEFVNCLFEDNAALAGSAGAIHAEHADPVLRRSIFRRNSAVTDGGAYSCDCDFPVFLECLFVGNTAMNGGALYFDGAVATIDRCTIVENSASQGGGLYAFGTPSVQVENSIVWGNVPEQLKAGPGGIFRVVYSDVEGGWLGAGNISADPQFEDPANGQYRLQASSPCIDAGNPLAQVECEQDVEGNPRLLDGLLDGTLQVDMGAYEFDHVRLEVTGSPSPGSTLTADLTGTQGLSAVLYVNTPATSPVLHPPYGCTYFSLSGPLWSAQAGTLPGSVSVTIPPGLPTPMLLIFQALGTTQPGATAGNLSNPVEVLVED